VETFTQAAIEIIKRIPKGKITTYGRIALMAGNPNGARQVARILHTSSRKHDLPWHRVVNRDGRVSLPRGNGYERQKDLLEQEGVVFDHRDRIDFQAYLWWPK